MEKMTFDGKYQRIDKKVVLLERDNRLYYQAKGANRFWEIQTYSTQDLKHILFEEVKSTDKIYAFDNETDPLKVAKKGTCMNTTVHVVKFSGEKKLVTELRKTIDEGYFVGAESVSGYWKEKQRVMKDDDHHRIIYFNKKGKQNSLGLSVENWDHEENGVTFYKTKDEFEFWSWLNQ